MYVGELDFAQRQIDRAIASLRAAGALGPLAFYLAIEAELAFRRASWADGLAAAEEAAAIAEETGQTPIAGYALALLARLEGASGRDAECRAHLGATERIAAASGSGALLSWGGHALGLLELGLGRHDEAIVALEPVAAVWETESMRCAEVLPWRHDLIEAYVRVGRAPEARRQLRSLAEEAHASGGAGALALTARCRGLIDPDHERHFEEALALHDRLPIPFDVARTRLCYGERLRRDRRRARAREQLEAALAGFDALGARPWADRARAELAAAGAPVPSPPASATESLTPRELQVALAVSRGATNREAAAALFVSEKTIERHLSAVYAKLGLRSRSELARHLAAAAGDYII
jgi:ATP/maltotriose-dependent transcriptional regulator MalT